MGQQESTALIPFENLPKGSHVCHFYRNARELSDAVIPYLRTGLVQNERCIWVCSEPLGAKAATDMFKENLPELAHLLGTEQIKIVSHDELYLDLHRRLDTNAILSRWGSEIYNSIVAGYSGLRITGNLSWAKSRQAILDYEERFCAFSLQTPMIALCSYPLQDMNVADIVEISYVHQFVLAMRNSTWELMPSARYRDLMWQSLLDTFSKGMLAINASGNIITASNMCLEFFGCTNLAGLGSNIREFARRFQIRSLTGRVRPDTPNSITSRDVDDYWKAISPAYGDLDLLVNIKTAKPNTVMPELYLLVFHDITGLRTLETIRENFLQVMSHELRNPIQTLKALLDLIEAYVAGRDTPLSKYTRLAESCLYRITALVEDLLSIGQMEHDSLTINAIPADFKELLIESLEPYLTGSQHVFVCRFDEEAGFPVVVDPVRIHQILANLLNNAVKYTPQGKRIWLDFSVLSKYAILSIADEGIGIPPAELDRIFDRFYRGKNTRGKFDGIGLGLYVSRCLARMHGGDLWAETRPQGGTVIKFSLPILINGACELDQTTADG
ncbi:MAG TPA: hypothetical protein GX529_07650 [Firmicutes bacterium]|nr:hypothetical protein [Candidatus Fermentithermobacillaceae bacterium]